MMRPVSLKVGAGDFAVAAGHRRIAISFVADASNPTAAFSMAAAWSGASTSPSKTALLAILQTFQPISFGGSGFLAMPAISAASYRPGNLSSSGIGSASARALVPQPA
jgi:hypothetical protein